MAAEPRVERLQVMLSSDELEALDNFRFANRLPSRASAIREILRRGLLAGEYEKPRSGAHSSHFGVLHAPHDPRGDN